AATLAGPQRPPRGAVRPRRRCRGARDSLVAAVAAVAGCRADPLTLRIDDLTTFAQFQQVERLEAEIWGSIDLVPVPIMAVTVKRGAVLVGAYDGDRLAG